MTIRNYFFLGILLLFSCVALHAQKIQDDIATEIKGTWISEVDPDYKLVISDSDYKEFSKDLLLETFTYELTYTYEGNETDILYLKLIDEEGSSYFYELYGANVEGSGILSMRYADNGKILVFDKQS
ncbi:hypothetical protein SAMN05216480_10374 [Pustulibacterium marinum]|uniref:DUF5640 domain-containing protein n=1 Tax=Pustulibacterium marinum TaxID=1224947 RepID=A0A1I7G1W6_9FLAO|nr:hypothetical protein [Pustulibacterium marinum]SFU42442.1 hypothetical protein SAMN05216480_10374 [Pustulibacterium marinum]